MYTAFTYVMLADEVSYNQAGADFIAGRDYKVLVTVLEE